MEQSQFKFNPEDLNFNQLDNSLGARIWRIVIYVVAVVVIAILLNVVYSLFFDTPRERQIRRENEVLQEQYDRLSERKLLVDTVMQEVEQIDRDIYRVIFETEPVEPGEQQVSGLTYQNLLLARDEDIVDNSARKLDSLIQHLNQLNMPGWYNAIVFLIQYRNCIHWHIKIQIYTIVIPVTPLFKIRSITCVLIIKLHLFIFQVKRSKI